MMNILDLLRETIIASFPDITSEELEIRINLARELIEHTRK